MTIANSNQRLPVLTNAHRPRPLGSTSTCRLHNNPPLQTNHKTKKIKNIHYIIISVFFFLHFSFPIILAEFSCIPVGLSAILVSNHTKYQSALEKMSFQDLEAGRPVSSLRRNLVNGKQDSTQAVASGIFQINTAVSTFQRLVNTLGTPKDTPELREKMWVLLLCLLILNLYSVELCNFSRSFLFLFCLNFEVLWVDFF